MTFNLTHLTDIKDILKIVQIVINNELSNDYQDIYINSDENFETEDESDFVYSKCLFFISYIYKGKSKYIHGYESDCLNSDIDKILFEEFCTKSIMNIVNEFKVLIVAHSIDLYDDNI